MNIKCSLRANAFVVFQSNTVALFAPVLSVPMECKTLGRVSRGSACVEWMCLMLSVFHSTVVSIFFSMTTPAIISLKNNVVCLPPV